MTCGHRSALRRPASDCGCVAADLRWRAAVTVSVGHDSSAVLLRVANGPGRSADPSGNNHGPGHGLTGMRERVALLGGALTAGATPGGGYRVAAEIPIEGAT